MVDITYQMMLSTLQTLALIVGIAYYLYTMRNSQRNQQMQLETRQAQLFMQLYDRWTFDIGEKFWEFVDDEMKTAEEYMEKLSKDKEFRKRISILSRYHEGVGVLVRFGLLDIRYIAYLASWPTRIYWEKLKPIIEDVRRLQNAPRGDSESEYLYNELMKYLEKHPELKT